MYNVMSLLGIPNPPWSFVHHCATDRCAKVAETVFDLLSVQLRNQPEFVIL